MAKRITAVIIAVLILCPSVFADGEQVLPELSLDMAITKAKENSREIESNEYEIKSGEIAIDAAKYSKNEYRKTPASSIEMLYVKRGYYLEAANMGLKLSKLKQNQINDSISYKVTENYYSCVLAERLVGIAENTYKLAVENKEAVDKYFELGMVSDLEVKNAALAVSGAEFAKESNQRNYDIARMNLNISMGVPTDNIYKLTDTIEIPELSSNLESDIKKALETRYDITASSENKKLSELYFEITSKYYTDTTSAYNSAYSSQITAQNNHENALLQMDLYIRTLYNSALAAKTSVEIAEGTLEIEKTEYEAAKLKFEMGMITNMELTSALNDMNKAETELEQAKLNLLLANKKYAYEISFGL